MKALTKLTGILLTVVVATACSSTYHTTDYVDDIYYSPGIVRAAPQQTADRGQTRVIEVVEEDYARPVQNTSGQQGATYAYDNDTAVYAQDEEKVVINNFYVDNYYDFAYASRIRRFHSSYAHFGYYDPFFTNMFFYTFHPLYYGVSIYYGYGAFPRYYGYGAHPFYFGHNPAFFYPHMNYYLYGMGWYGGFPYAHGYRHSYWMGYHTGFHHGLWAGGYNPYIGSNYIYNSFDRDSYRYGHMGSGGSTVGRRATSRDVENFADRFESRTVRDDSGRRQIIAEERILSGRELASRDNERTATRPADQGAATHARVDEQGRGREVTTRPAQATDPNAERVVYQPARRPEDYRAPSREQYEGANIERYARPQQSAPNRELDRGASSFTPPRTYTPPSYQQPGTPQRARPATTTPGTDARPATTTQPSRNERGRPAYTPPQQQPTRTTTTPSRTTTTPARATTPSRTTTAPARTTAPPTRSTPPPSRTTTTTRSAPPPSSSSSGTSSNSGSRNTSSGGRQR